MGVPTWRQATRARSYRTPWLPEAGTSSTGNTGHSAAEISAAPVDLRAPTDERPKAFARTPTRSRQPRRSAQVGISSGSSDRADRQRCSLKLPLDQHGEHFAGVAQIEGIIPTAGLDRTNTCTPHVAGVEDGIVVGAQVACAIGVIAAAMLAARG
jgi:hypothetical protein